jgi:hypothetical protein
MKIDYEIKNNTCKIYNEIQGMALSKKRIKKNKKYLKFNSILLIQLIIIFIISIINLFISSNNNLYLVFAELNAFLITFLIFEIVLFYLMYYLFRRNLLVGEVLIDDYGLLDSNSNVKTGMSWKMLECCVITKNGVYFLTKKNMVYIYNLEIKEDIIKAIKKYNKDFKIIDYTK